MTFFQYIYYLFYWILYHTKVSIGLIKPKIREPIKDMDQEYVNTLKTKFLSIFTSTIDYNENVDPIFYQKNILSEILSDPRNKIETIWKTRILFENTTKGNVIMYYDPYKLGFSYYCDQNVISYDILNAIAMKYVTIFRCLHFFIDETVTPKDNCSPFLNIYFNEKTEKNDNNKSKIMEKHPFIKRKPNTQKISNNNEITQLDTEKIKNKFIYLGKLRNFQWTQPVTKKQKVLAKFSSPLLENIIKDSGVQRETISYSDYKNIQNKI